MSVTYDDIAYAIEAMELSGKIIFLHSSIKSFGHVEGGVPTIINPLIDRACTVVVPTFYYNAIVPPPEGKQYAQNGMDVTESTDFNDSEILPYTGGQDMITSQMGAIPAGFLRRADKIRGNHPVCSFTAVGPEAQRVISNQAPLQVYAPYESITTDDEAYLVLMGVDLTKATPIHYAEQLAGRRLFRRWAKVANQEIVETENGGCSDGFNSLAPWVSAIERKINVGESRWRIYPFKPFVNRIAEAIRRNPSITRCDSPICSRCNDAVKGGPITSLLLSHGMGE